MNSSSRRQTQHQAQHPGQSLTQWQIRTPAGPLYLVASERGLRALLWRPAAAPFARSLARAEEDPALALLARAERQLSEYFAGARREFDLPLDPVGTEFQRRVWRELARIPYGKTASYRDVARRIRNARAVRAVGTANGRNPLSIVVPCHRVIGSDGALRGYAGGSATKARLLAFESGREKPWAR